MEPSQQVLDALPVLGSNDQSEVPLHQRCAEEIQFKMNDGSIKTITLTERFLGKGGQASVYYAIDKKTDKEYAVKIFTKLDYYERERELLSKAQSKNVVELHGEACNLDRKQYCLLLEFCNCDLMKLIKVRTLIPEDQAETIIESLFRAQYELNTKIIIHRDLKPSNIAIKFKHLTTEASFNDKGDAVEFLKNFDFVKNEQNFQIKFFDFGFSEAPADGEFSSDSTSGTPAYSSPEQLRGGF